MIDGRPNVGGQQTPSQKLILPDPNAVYSPPNSQTQRGYPLQSRLINTQRGPIPPMPPPPTNKRNWRKDPAFLVLLAAICADLIGGTAFAFIANNVLTPNTPSNTQKAYTPPNTTGTPSTNPTTGTSQSATPTAQPTQAITVTVQPSPTIVPTTPPVQPTPTQPVQGQNGPLTIQVNNVPGQVLNNSVVPISVTTSVPNSSVQLFATYNASPFFSSSKTQTTDANGNATINWVVSVRMFGRINNSIVAHISVSVHDNNNQQAVSQTYTVQIQVRGIIPG